MQPRILITRKGGRLIITKANWKRYLAYILIVFSIFFGTISAWGLHYSIEKPKGIASVVIFLLGIVYCAIEALVTARSLSLDRNIQLEATDSYLSCNDEWIEYVNLKKILVIKCATRYGDWTYKVALVDRTGYHRFLAMFVQKAEIIKITTFIQEHVDLPVETERTSWSYRLKDLAWGSGLWERVPNAPDTINPNRA